ncbi:MAG: hypothetical protein ACXWXZ_18655, partial [Candidatus Binatia bacterium]
YSLIAKGTTGFRLDSMIKCETFAGVLNAPWDAKAAAAGMVRFADRIIPAACLPSAASGLRRIARC